MENKNYKIGSIKATALVAGNMIGSGVLLSPAILAPYGTMSIVGWIITTIGAIALSLVFSKLSVLIPKAGGPYTFAKHIFGDFIGFQMAWGYWISCWCGSVSLLAGTLQYMSIFWPDLCSNTTFNLIFGISMIWLFTFINMRGMKESTFAQVIIFILKVAPIVLIAIVGIFFVDFSKVFNLSDIKNHGISSFAMMAQPLLWAFIGLESATVPSEQIVNPQKTIPIATVSGVLITASVYIFGAIVINGLIPYAELINSKAPYVDAAIKIFGTYGGWFMIITGLIGLIGSLNGWILIQGQVSYSATQENLFPTIFGKTNKKGVPYGSVIGSICMTIVFLLSYQSKVVEQIKLLIEVSVLAMLLPYFYSVVAYFFMLKKEHQFSNSFTNVMIFIIAFIYTFFAIFSSSENIIFIGFMMFLMSVPFYCFVKKNSVNNTQKIKKDVL